MEIEDYIIQRITQEIRKKGISKKFFAEKIINKSEAWLHNKLQKRRLISCRDLEIIADGLEIAVRDLFPNVNGQRLDTLPLAKVIRNIAKEEIELYIKENFQSNQDSRDQKQEDHHH